MHPRRGNSPRVSAIALTLAGALIFAAPGCGYLRAEYARANTLSQQLDRYVIPKPIAEVWASARDPSGTHDTLMWNGLGFTWSETAPWKMRTSSKASKEKGAGGDRHDVLTWFECEAVAVPGGTQVHYFEQTETRTFRGGADLGTELHSKRRLDLEIELVKHFDPAAAQRIEAAAQAAADSAK
jgi:hypothetical protein